MSLRGKIALVAGATLGAGRGIAVELGAAGATVYVTGRTTRTRQSEYARPETIEETAELINAAGGHGIAIQVDHLVPEQVKALNKTGDSPASDDCSCQSVWRRYLRAWSDRPPPQRTPASVSRLCERARLSTR